MNGPHCPLGSAELHNHNPVSSQPVQFLESATVFSKGHSLVLCLLQCCFLLPQSILLPASFTQLSWFPWFWNSQFRFFCTCCDLPFFLPLSLSSYTVFVDWTNQIFFQVCLLTKLWNHALLFMQQEVTFEMMMYTTFINSCFCVLRSRRPNQLISGICVAGFLLCFGIILLLFIPFLGNCCKRGPWGKFSIISEDSPPVHFHHWLGKNSAYYAFIDSELWVFEEREKERKLVESCEI